MHPARMHDANQRLESFGSCGKGIFEDSWLLPGCFSAGTGRAFSVVVSRLRGTRCGNMPPRPRLASRNGNRFDISSENALKKGLSKLRVLLPRTLHRHPQCKEKTHGKYQHSRSRHRGSGFRLEPGVHYTGAVMGMPYAARSIALWPALILIAILTILGATLASGGVEATVGQHIIGDRSVSIPDAIVMVLSAGLLTFLYNAQKIPTSTI